MQRQTAKSSVVSPWCLRSGKMLAGAPKVRDPRSQQTIRSLWDPLYDFTEPDKDADAFSPMAGGVEGVVAVAGHRRIK